MLGSESAGCYFKVGGDVGILGKKKKTKKLKMGVCICIIYVWSRY